MKKQILLATLLSATGCQITHTMDSYQIPLENEKPSLNESIKKYQNLLANDSKLSFKMASLLEDLFKMDQKSKKLEIESLSKEIEKTADEFSRVNSLLARGPFMQDFYNQGLEMATKIKNLFNKFNQRKKTLKYTLKKTIKILEVYNPDFDSE